jgi:hypothetical protein
VRFRMLTLCLLSLLILPLAASGAELLESGRWSRETLLGVDMADDAPVGLDLLSLYRDGDLLRLSLVQAADPVTGERLIPDDARFEIDFGAGLRLNVEGRELRAGRGRLELLEGTERSRLATEFDLTRDNAVWRLPADLAARLPRAGLVTVTVSHDGAVVDRLDADPGRDYLAHCALMHHGNQSLTGTDVFHGRWDDEEGSGFDEALQVHEATNVPGNFHLSGPLQSSADWDALSGDPVDFNAWLASGAAAGWAGMITSAYAQHIMPFVSDTMNDWSVNIHSDMTAARYGYSPTVAWVPERVWLTPGQYPGSHVIDHLADNFLDHGVGAVILDDDVHCAGYDNHQIHTLAGSSLRIIPRDSNFTGQLHAGNGAGALSVLTGLAGGGVGDFRIAVYADDWEMAAEIGEWANSMPNHKETYDWFVWKCYDESAWLSTWKLSDAVADARFNGVASMNAANGTYFSIGGFDGYGGADNAWYGHWAGFVPWVTGGDGNGNCAGSGGSCQNYGDMWNAAQSALLGAPSSAISEAGWFVMMTNLYETGWHDYMGGPISGWENNHSAHVKNARYFAEAAHWGAGEWTSPALNATLTDIDGDGFDELVIHNERLMAVIESAGGRIVHLSLNDGGFADTAIGIDNAYWFGTDGDFNDGNHVAGLSDVHPDSQSLPYDMSVDIVAADSVQVTLSRDGVAKTLILKSGEPWLRCRYSTASETYVKSGFSPSLVDLIWGAELERVWGPGGSYMGFRNPDTGLFAGLLLGGGGAQHSSEFSGRLMKGDELRGSHRFEFWLYAGLTDAPVGGEIPALDAAAALLTDVIPPAVASAVYFPGTDRLRLELDESVDLGALDPTKIAIDDDGDGNPELTLAATTTIDGFGWQDRADLVLTPADAALLEGLDTASLTLLMETGAFADGSGLSNAPLTAADALPVFYGPPTLITIDGEIDHQEWISCQLAVDDPDNDSSWSVLNELQTLYLTVDETYLYLGLEGRVENFNGWLIHLDADYGAGTGEWDLSELPSWDKNAVFTYPGTGIDFLYGSWAGANGNFYSIDGPTSMTELSDLGVILSSDQGAPWPGSELAIPWDLLYGLGEDALPVGATLGFSAAVASGTELGGDVMPSNLSAALPTVDNLALIPLDVDGDGVPDKPDHESPLLLSAAPDAASDTLAVLRFSEPMDPATAENPVFYRVWETAVPERQLAIYSAALSSGDSLVTLVTNPQDPVDYTVGVFGLRDGSCYLNVINPNSSVAFEGSSTGAPADAAPVAFALLPNWPNPFNPKTRIAFTLGEAGPVDLTIHDISGRRLAVLVTGYHEAGRHELDWEGRDDRGHRLASGLYFAVIRSTEGRQTRKMMLLK